MQVSDQLHTVAGLKQPECEVDCWWKNPE